jgi:hypothetical protein
MIAALVLPALALGVARSATAQGGGTIVGEVRLAGTPPPPKTVTVNKDTTVCRSEKKIADVAAGPQHGLAEAVVAVPDVKSTQPAAKAVLDQKGCEFHPDVLVMKPGDLDILNSDGVLHNIHSFSKLNAPFNKSQPKFKKVLSEEIAKPEIIRVQCDVHSWMHGWLFVTDNPAADTDTSGRFKLEGIPAGKHKIQVWHPVLGTQTKEVVVKPGQATEVVFELATKSG